MHSNLSFLFWRKPYGKRVITETNVSERDGRWFCDKRPWSIATVGLRDRGGRFLELNASEGVFENQVHLWLLHAHWTENLHAVRKNWGTKFPVFRSGKAQLTGYLSQISNFKKTSYKQ